MITKLHVLQMAARAMRGRRGSRVRRDDRY
jgi:hypothetical protein